MTNRDTYQKYVKKKKVKIDQSIKKWFERLNDKEYLETPGIRNFDQQTFDRTIITPVEKMLATGGKRVRPLVTYLSHDIVGGREPLLDSIAILPELVHKGSIAIDDIEDNSQSRDFQSALHKEFGTPIALNAANFLYFAPSLIPELLDLDKHRRLKIMQEFFNLGVLSHVGQGADVYWNISNKDINHMPTERQYLQMCEYKAQTVVFSSKLGAILGNATQIQQRNLVAILKQAAIAYQLQDDVLDLSKGMQDYGNDIQEGKISLAIIKILERDDTNSKRVKTLLAQERKTDEEIQDIIEIMKTSGAVEYVQKRAHELTEKATDCLYRRFDDSQHRETLANLIQYLVLRKT